MNPCPRHRLATFGAQTCGYWSSSMPRCHCWETAEMRPLTVPGLYSCIWPGRCVWGLGRTCVMHGWNLVPSSSLLIGAGKKTRCLANNSDFCLMGLVVHWRCSRCICVYLVRRIGAGIQDVMCIEVVHSTSIFIVLSINRSSKVCCP